MNEEWAIMFNCVPENGHSLNGRWAFSSGESDQIVSATFPALFQM